MEKHRIPKETFIFDGILINEEYRRYSTHLDSIIRMRVWIGNLEAAG